jgi:hypothetical protein
MTSTAFDVTRATRMPHSTFLVTAEHLPEWCGDVSIRRQEPLLRVVSHLANGAKHFRVTDPRHNSVTSVGSRPGLFDPRIFDPRLFDTGGLYVELTSEEAQNFGLAVVTVLRLANEVLQYWEQRFAR